MASAVKAAVDAASQRAKDGAVTSLTSALDTWSFTDSSIAAAAKEIVKTQKEGAQAATRDEGATDLSLRLEDVPSAFFHEDPLVISAAARLLCTGLFNAEYRYPLWEKHRTHLVTWHLFMKALPSGALSDETFKSKTMLLQSNWPITDATSRSRLRVGTTDATINVLTVQLALSLVTALPRLMQQEEPLDCGAVLDKWLQRHTPPPAPSARSAAAAVRHVAINCTSCGEEIVGKRWRCTQCTGLDLCSVCFETQPHLPYGSRLHTQQHDCIAHTTPLPRAEPPTVIASLTEYLALLGTCLTRSRLLQREAVARAKDGEGAAATASPRVAEAATAADDALPEPSASEIDAVFAAARTPAFVQAMNAALIFTLAFATDPREFDLKWFGCGRVGPLQYCLTVLQALVAEDAVEHVRLQYEGFLSFLLRSLCQPASMQDRALAIVDKGLTLLLNLATIPGISAQLVEKENALLWLSPLLHHPRPHIVLNAVTVVAVLAYCARTGSGEGDSSSGSGIPSSYGEFLQDALEAARLYPGSQAGLGNLTPACLSALTGMVMLAGEGSRASGSTNEQEPQALVYLGMHGLTRVVSGGVNAADWAPLQGQPPAFFSILQRFAQDSSQPDTARMASSILTELGHVVPPLRVVLDEQGALAGSRTGSGGAASTPAFLGLHRLRSPVHTWDTDAVCLWVSMQAFHQHTQAFRDAWVNGRTLVQLTDGHLQEMGVARPVHRTAILTAIRRLAAKGRADVDRMGQHGQQQGEEEDGAAADVFLCTPCEGGQALAQVLAAQLVAAGLRVVGYTPPPALLVTTHGQADAAAADGASSGAPTTTSSGSSVTFMQEAAVNAAVASAKVVLLVLAPRTLALSQSVGPAVAALPTCVPALLHAALVREVSAALRLKKPMLAVASHDWVWPLDSAAVVPELAPLHGVLLGEAAAPAAATAAVAAPIAATPSAAAGSSAAEAGKAEGEAKAASAAAAAPAAAPIPVPADTDGPFTLPTPTPSGGRLVKLSLERRLLASGALAQAVAQALHQM